MQEEKMKVGYDRNTKEKEDGIQRNNQLLIGLCMSY